MASEANPSACPAFPVPANVVTIPTKVDIKKEWKNQPFYLDH
jgi:hypothetical protein